MTKRSLKYRRVTIDEKSLDYYRLRKFWTWGELAFRSEVSPATVFAINAGKHEASIKTLLKIAVALNVSPVELLEDMADAHYIIELQKAYEKLKNEKENEEKLLVCPFCGSEVKLEYGFRDYHIKCRHCGIGLLDGYRDRLEAIRRWNQRIK